MFSKIFKIFSIKLNFFNPKKANVLIFDNHSNLSGYSKILFPKENFETLYTRYEQVNLPIFLKTIAFSGFKNLKEKYYKNFLESVKPKIVYTAIDNSIRFYSLKKLYPKSVYIADQNGHRQNDYYIQLKKRKMKNKINECDYYFLQGKNNLLKLERLINGKKIILGNTINNNFPKKGEKKKKRIVYISSKIHRRANLEKKIFTKLILFCKKNKYNLTYLDRPGANNYSKLVKVFNDKSWTYFSNNDQKKKYKLLNSSSLIAFAMSTLGYESLSKGLKCISFNHTFYNNDLEKKYNDTGPFWVPPDNYKKVEKKILDILKLKNKEWNKIYKKYSYQILWRDDNNKRKKEIINSILGN